MSEIQVYTTPMMFRVCALPFGHKQHDLYAIYVYHRAENQYSIVRAAKPEYWFSVEGTWDRLPRLPQAGPAWDAWRDTHSFLLGTALSWANKLALEVECNGRTAEQLVALKLVDGP